MTDIHLQPEKNAIQVFQKAIDMVNELDPDFVITGRDNIMDALAQNRERSDPLYSLFDSMNESFSILIMVGKQIYTDFTSKCRLLRFTQYAFLL